MRTDLSKHSEWKWEESVVDAKAEHIELRLGDASSKSYKEWIPVARIGKPENKVFPVQWLIQQDSSDRGTIMQVAQRELDFYLVEKGEPNPWGYAQYHCNTTANLYSSIHWFYYPNGQKGSGY